MTDQRRLVFIICAGHAVMKCDGNPMIQEGLVLLDYQRDNKHYLLFQEHVGKSLQLLDSWIQDNCEAYLVFSGGITRSESPYSEAETYMEIAKHRPEWEDKFEDLIVLEEFARDSYENCLFGLAAGFCKSGRIPDEVVMVSFKFKEQRFCYHAASIGLAAMIDPVVSSAIPKFTFVGVGNPPNLGGALVGEAKALDLFLFDPHGLSKECNEKRKDRNPKGRFNNYQEGVASWPLVASLISVNNAASR